VSKHEKAVRRLCSKPKDFTWSELVSILNAFGFEMEQGPGSSRKFIHPSTQATLYIHQLHPSRLLKPYQVRDAIELLKQEGFLK